jgi:hypothetical protein
MSMESKKDFWDPVVDRIDSFMRNATLALMAISIGCILGVRNLTGLGSAQMPDLGIPN